MRFIVSASCLGLFLGALWATRPGADVLPYPSKNSPAMPRADVPAAPVAAPGRQWLDESARENGGGDIADAATSMAQARLHGDERTPPLQPRMAAEIAPTPAQLADPAAYRRYEQGTHARTLDAFAAAVEAELPRLRADVARARVSGIAPEEIRKVEAKIERLERARREIVDADARN